MSDKINTISNEKLKVILIPLGIGVAVFLFSGYLLESSIISQINSMDCTHLKGSWGDGNNEFGDAERIQKYPDLLGKDRRTACENGLEEMRKQSKSFALGGSFMLAGMSSFLIAWTIWPTKESGKRKGIGKQKELD